MWHLVQTTYRALSCILGDLIWMRIVPSCVSCRVVLWLLPSEYMPDKGNARSATQLQAEMHCNKKPVIRRTLKRSIIVISMSVRPSVRSFVHSSVTDYYCWLVVVCVRFSSETTRLISPMMIPINWGNNVDVQCTLHFDFHPSMTVGQGHKILQFCEFRCLTGSSLCSLLLRNYSTDFSSDDTNQLREQCRCAMYTSFWPWPLHDCMSRAQNTSIL